MVDDESPDVAATGEESSFLQQIALWFKLWSQFSDQRGRYAHHRTNVMQIYELGLAAMQKINPTIKLLGCTGDATVYPWSELNMKSFGGLGLGSKSFVETQGRRETPFEMALRWIGYLASEYASSGQVTEKANEYPFGVILLEMVTGWRSLDIALESHRMATIIQSHTKSFSGSKFQRVILAGGIHREELGDHLQRHAFGLGNLEEGEDPGCQHRHREAAKQAPDSQHPEECRDVASPHRGLAHPNAEAANSSREDI
ncbi:hypothetical protein SELMODRAFT_420955 [Selaginella moellendorffii]|uniref:Serine-threonine/tyrosine-protein kinase catalytic domain-containing protein n=1 Tax=Selaginella moellendorffii TaxID=88036 RepID=D8SDN6_SELML|nr:hypothetical protein SELMODRAFT_420955 [Selaginella moellendorffii]